MRILLSMIYNFFSLKILIFVLMSIMGIFGIFVIVWFFILIYLRIRKSEIEET